jgi:site-specific DNA recombinase
MSGRVRCAIYTRKSSEEGLEQSFNSLDAQREACDAYIRSQKHEGWTASSTKYDDGGFSGGNMDRPALKKLMADISEGKVNTVVVYKVDRLTRSLADFAKMIELFDSRQVSFVSVTQQFNTTTSMGRLMLNVLLSFAQFEREVTGERIRDKIAASKQKGMWMGGRVPLGYDLRDRKLYINAVEAERVREIFSQYLLLGCVSALKEHLDKGPIRSKVRISGGRQTGGERFSRGALYRILGNHLYVGEIEHKKNVYRGEHEAIIDRNVWDQVQKQLEENQQGAQTRIRSTKGSLLTGILFDEEGNRLTPTHALKNGKRYRYYTSQAVIRKSGEVGPAGRIPALELEHAISSRILESLCSPLEMLNAAKEIGIQEANSRNFLKRAGRKAQKWPMLPIPDQEAFLKSILHRVIVRSDSIEIRLNARSLLRVVLEKQAEQAGNLGEFGKSETFTLQCPFKYVSRGPALRIVIGNDQGAPTESAVAITNAIARARFWYDEIVAGRAISIPDLAKQHGVTPRYVKKILPCALLGPDVVEAILKHKNARHLTLKSLLEAIPMSWASQKVAV